MRPLRREIDVTAPGHVDDHAVAAPGLLRVYVVRRAGESRFRRVGAGTEVGPGDRLVVYEIDLAQPARIEHLNWLSNQHSQVGPALVAAHRLWDDERDAIARWVPDRDARVLEICCGTGRVTHHLVRGGNDVHGVDNSPASIAVARGAYPGPSFAVGDAAALAFPDDRFDVATCWQNSMGILFSKQVPALRELLRVTRPGGRVVLGLREVPQAARDVQIYTSRDGWVELVQTFRRERVQAVADRLVAGCRCVARYDLTPPADAAQRPWGGHLLYLVLHLEAV